MWEKTPSEVLIEKQDGKGNDGTHLVKRNTVPL
jgi:hypothetical protein